MCVKTKGSEAYTGERVVYEASQELTASGQEGGGSQQRDYRSKSKLLSLAARVLR